MMRGMTSPPLLPDRRATALVEFALLLPLLLVLILGMIGFGQYMFVAHGLQQVAHDAARAALAGITEAEREQLALSDVARGLASGAVARPALVEADVDEDAGRLTVTLSTDTRALGLLRPPLVPMPDPVIERRGTVLLGGMS